MSDSATIVDHLNPIDIDATLALPKLIDLAMEKYPDTAWLISLEEAAAAIAEATASVQAPLWNLGQRDAEHNLKVGVMP